MVDSGNSLVDTLTRKQIVLVSKMSLLKFLSQKEIEKLLSSARKIKCKTVAEKDVVLPIINCKEIKVEIADSENVYACMLGFVNEKFENGRFDCLLPRDFL